MSGPPAPAHLVPLMRYRDVGIASEWLCAAFGFEPNFAAKAPDGSVFYAELRLGDSMIMLGAAGEPSPGDVMGESGVATEVGQTQSCYVVLHDVDVHYDQAKRAGAAITLDIKSDDIGGRGYSCRDLEGHIWNFGTYDPWKGQTKSSRNKYATTAKTSSSSLRAAMVLTLAVSIISGWFVYGQIRGSADGLTLERLRQALLGPHAPDGSLSTGGIIRPDDGSETQLARGEVKRAHKAMAALKEELEQERRAKANALEAASQAQANVERAQADAAQAKAAAEKAQIGVTKAQADVAKTQADAQKSAKVQAEQVDAARQDAERAQTALAATKAKAIAELQTDLDRQPPARDRLAAQHDAVQTELKELRSARDAAVKSAAEAESALADERATKDSALKALADAGARIATLEIELKAAKDDAAQLRRLRAAAVARERERSKKQPPGTEPWPYSEW